MNFVNKREKKEKEENFEAVCNRLRTYVHEWRHFRGDGVDRVLESELIN